MGLTSIWHWIILLIVVVALFGTSKLKNAGKDLGQAVKGFKDAIKDENEKQSALPPSLPSDAGESVKTPAQSNKPSDNA